jgi:hypothetical protein
VRGFIAGSLGLIALSVVVSAGQPTSSRTDKVVQGLGLTSSLFRRLFSPTVAGIPQKAK